MKKQMTKEEEINTIKNLCALVLKEAEIAQLTVFKGGLEDEQWWIDYQDKLNELSVKRIQQ